MRERGRPRGFDLEQALAAGQQLFHARGYDAIGIAALTDALGIKPPSFYAAFGSKADFFERVLNIYAASVLALEDVLRPGREPAVALADLMERAARTYAADPKARGCLVLEAVRGNDDDVSTGLARKVAERRRKDLHDFVSVSHASAATSVADFVASTMSGLSASAREGMSEDRLVAIARAAAHVLPTLLTDGLSGVHTDPNVPGAM